MKVVNFKQYFRLTALNIIKSRGESNEKVTSGEKKMSVHL
jgi:hypothetical protein